MPMLFKQFSTKRLQHLLQIDPLMKCFPTIFQSMDMCTKKQDSLLPKRKASKWQTNFNYNKHILRPISQQTHKHTHVEWKRYMHGKQLGKRKLRKQQARRTTHMINKNKKIDKLTNVRIVKKSINLRSNRIYLCGLSWKRKRERKSLRYKIPIT